jgi:IS30 family transposase
MSSRISLELEPAFDKPTNKGGRPRKEIAQHTFERLCEVQCTLEEMAHVLNVSEDTIERWCKRTYELGFADTYKKFSAFGKTSLRRYQFEAAKKGNPTMQIWLGKQYLGQSDKPSEMADQETNAAEIATSVVSLLVALAERNRGALAKSSDITVETC